MKLRNFSEFQANATFNLYFQLSLPAASLPSFLKSFFFPFLRQGLSILG